MHRLSRAAEAEKAEFCDTPSHNWFIYWKLCCLKTYFCSSLWLDRADGTHKPTTWHVPTNFEAFFFGGCRNTNVYNATENPRFDFILLFVTLKSDGIVGTHSCGLISIDPTGAVMPLEMMKKPSFSHKKTIDLARSNENTYHYLALELNLVVGNSIATLVAMRRVYSRLQRLQASQATNHGMAWNLTTSMIVK